MTYSIEFADGVEKQISKFRKSNPTAFTKLKKLLFELMEHPRKGTGHPEPLKGGDGITWSRRITQKDTMFAEVFGRRSSMV